MIQAIAFDFGGTLFSTAKMGEFTRSMTDIFINSVICESKYSREDAVRVFDAYVKAWQVRRRRADTIPEREVSSIDLLHSAFSDVGKKLSESQKIKILNAFHAEESKQFSPLPNILETLPKLVQNKYRLCIVSNNPWSESIRASLTRHKIESFFERVIVSSDVGFRKPHRQIFDELLKQLGLPPSDILFVGDSFTHDIEMPKKLGMRTCLVDFEGSNKNNQMERAKYADIFLTQFDQLVRAISKLDQSAR